MKIFFDCAVFIIGIGSVIVKSAVNIFVHAGFSALGVIFILNITGLSVCIIKNGLNLLTFIVVSINGFRELCSAAVRLIIKGDVALCVIFFLNFFEHVFIFVILCCADDLTRVVIFIFKILAGVFTLKVFMLNNELSVFVVFVNAHYCACLIIVYDFKGVAVCVNISLLHQNAFCFVAVAFDYFVFELAFFVIIILLHNYFAGFIILT